jgi:hypothetical protein
MLGNDADKSSTGPERKQTMNHVRRIFTTAAALLVIVVGLLATTPAAFAVNLAPGGSGSPAATTFGAQAGMAGWEITLIALGAALVATLLTAVASHARYRRLTSPGPAAT